MLPPVDILLPINVAAITDVKDKNGDGRVLNVAD